MNIQTAQSILHCIDEFNNPIKNLGTALNQIEGPDERKKYRKYLGEIMAMLECDTAQPIRKLKD